MFLGIDLGTSSVKFVLLDDEQNVVAQHSQPLSISQPKPLWSEQHPHDWWQATHDGMRALKAQHTSAFGKLTAIGLSGQQHGATLLDANNNVLRPAILWNDGRSFAECEEIAAQIPHYTSIVGNRMMAGFTAPKIRWVAKNEPDVFKKLAKILLPKDYLRLKMTGEFATDVSDASGTGWLNPKMRDWSDEMLAACQLTRAHMPNLFEGSEITGTISASLAAEWGIPHNTVLVGGGGDNPAGAISVNVIEPGSAFLSLGTSGVYFVSNNTYQANPSDGLHTFCHCLPDHWHHMSVHLSAANCLSWLSSVVHESNLNLLLAEAETNSNPEQSIIFLPYLSGERTPHNNPHAKAVFFGMTNATQRADLTRAVLEGVAFAFADGQDAMLNAGIEISSVSVVGGGAQSYYWGTILAAVLQRPLIYRTSRDVGAALGAARLAWLAINKSDPRQAFNTPPIEKIIEPDKNLSAYYCEKLNTFRALYQRTKDLF